MVNNATGEKIAIYSDNDSQELTRLLSSCPRFGALGRRGRGGSRIRRRVRRAGDAGVVAPAQQIDDLVGATAVTVGDALREVLAVHDLARGRAAVTSMSRSLTCRALALRQTSSKPADASESLGHFSTQPSSEMLSRWGISC